MAETVQITRSLLSAPLPQIVERLGISIAQAQAALDANSVKIAKEMVDTKVKLGDEMPSRSTICGSGADSSERVIWTVSAISCGSYRVRPGARASGKS